MFEVHSKNKVATIKFSESEKIIISDSEFMIEGDINSIGIKFAKHMSQGDIDYQTFKAGKLHVYGYLEKYSQKRKMRMTWGGNISNDWIKFHDIFERYFNMKCFL